MSNLTKSLTDEITSVAGIASAVSAHAMSYGIDIAPICRALDIDPALFQSLTERISLDRLCRLLEACSVLSNDEAFGLRCAEKFVAGSTGPFGYGLMAAPTVNHFLHFLEDHVQYATHTSFFKLALGEKFVELAWTFAPVIVKRDQYVDMSVALVMQRLRDIVAGKWETVEMDLERPRPRNLQIFKELLARRINFGAKINKIRVPTELLSLRNPRGDEKLFNLMDIQCRSMRPTESVGSDSFVDQVRNYMMLRIADPAISLRDIAPYFGISERTFQRRLSEHDTNLNDIRDQVRRDLSLRLLTDSELPISEICYRLGYSAPSAFTRSVTRWFGTTPKAMRERRAG
ncbi:AraC family transcriptional regulator ligand-binding domain-containing protein [Ciceribacter sp. L1K23]|uniref:AraC family transcriptional regulator n=1 Tax=Ciceribacter sp. L1K23 TaxID=2820276 RepID=UPI0032C243A7